jgi:hypothetical protein
VAAKARRMAMTIELDRRFVECRENEQSDADLVARFGLSLLKIQFGALEGRDKQRAASPILGGSTFIAMMQAANFREDNNVIACGR